MRYKPRLTIGFLLCLIGICCALLAVFRPVLLTLLGQPAITASQVENMATQYLRIEVAKKFPEPVEILESKIVFTPPKRLPLNYADKQLWEVQLRFAVGERASGWANLYLNEHGKGFDGFLDLRDDLSYRMYPKGHPD